MTAAITLDFIHLNVWKSKHKSHNLCNFNVPHKLKVICAFCVTQCDKRFFWNEFMVKELLISEVSFLKESSVTFFTPNIFILEITYVDKNVWLNLFFSIFEHNY